MKRSDSHIEKPLGKERMTLADYYPPNERGGSGSVNRLPLSPALEATADLDHLFEGCWLRSKGVRWKDSVLGFRANILSNIVRLRDELLSGRYKLLPYMKFTIYEPKERSIEATAFRDGVVQKSLCKNYLYKAITKSFIRDNSANQVGKGTDFARDRFKAQLHRYWLKHGCNGYVLQFDVHNFFGSIPHDKLKAHLSKTLGDPFAVAYCIMAVDSYGGDNGIGLGSELSQLMALSYLSGIDHLFKEKMKAEVYERYMDDGNMVFSTKAKAKEALATLAEEIGARGLELNPKKTRIFKLGQPITFLGWRFFLKQNGRIVCKPRKGKTRKMKSKALRMKRAGIAMDVIKESFDSSLASLLWGDAGKEIKDLKRFYKEEIEK